MKAAVSDDAELKQRLADLLRPPARKDDFFKQEAKWKRQSAERRRREQRSLEKSKDYLLKHVDSLRDNKFEDRSGISSSQWWLHERLREKSGSLNKWTGGNWRDLVAEFGAEVANAYRDGVVAYWRNYRPLLRSEGAEANSVPHKVIFGLTSIGIEAAETPNWAAGLTEIDAELACRYACHELNGFPRWFPNLFQVWPEIAAKTLLHEIEYELSVDTEDQETHYILSDVSWSGQWSWPAFAPEVFRLLKENDPKNAQTLNKLLKIVQGADISSSSDLTVLAGRKALTAASSHRPIWFATWVGVEPEKAIPALAAHIESIEDGSEQTQFAMRFVTCLFGSRGSDALPAGSAFQTPQHLKTLYLLMHKYIRRGEDIERAGGGVYSPELRDDAQEARNKLFDALHRQSGKAAFLAMRDIAENYPEGASPGWLMRLTLQKAEQEADITPWTPSQVRDFHEKLDRMPRNHRELADIAVLRLLDLKDDLENGDSSVARLVQRAEQETEVRNYLAHELREKAFGRYNIPQEDELADAKRPDLRFLGFGFPGAVPAELKLADAGWSGPSLFERMENQLAGDYLRDIHSGRGILVLVTRGGKQTWQHPETGQPLDFEQFVIALREHWTKISPRFPNVEDIHVTGIDLGKRFLPPKG